tara:strand:- start:7948 stop:8232 length:285 start_codon:yes stop_codon:yes gene_type:complete
MVIFVNSNFIFLLLVFIGINLGIKYIHSSSAKKSPKIALARYILILWIIAGANVLVFETLIIINYFLSILIYFSCALSGFMFVGPVYRKWLSIR